MLSVFAKQFFAKELNAFDLVFVEEIEDLKYNYQPARKNSVLIEKN